MSKHKRKGRVKFIKSGNAFIEDIEKDESFFVHRKYLNNILPYDIVEYKIGYHYDKMEVTYVNLFKRTKTNYVVNITTNKKGSCVMNFVDKSMQYIPVVDSPIEELIKYNNKKVKVEILDIINTDFHSEAKVLIKIVDVIGDISDNNSEIESILIDNEIDISFDKRVLNEVKHIPTEITKKEINRRRDMRNVCTFTIDPHNSKDFDDALSVKILNDNNYQIGIHIADVSHYVKMGSELEQEAFKRGNSVYLVDRVIPMLPHKLSNEICSLNPNEDRLAYSLVLTFNENFEIIDKWLGKTIIHSDKRFTYEEANDILHLEEDVKFKKQLTLLYNISKFLRNKRMKSALDFKRSEVSFKLDDKGNPIGLKVKKSIPTNHLIEEFMLLANRTVGDILKENKTGVFRIHESPNMERMEEISSLTSLFGIKFNLYNNADKMKKEINRFLNSVKESSHNDLFNTLMIKAQSKAKYSTENLGHYGLGKGFENYTHFTSPIRRYSDYIVHIILSESLNYK